MPDVDGIELLRHLRGNESFSAVPVVSASLLVAESLICWLVPPSLHSLLGPTVVLLSWLLS